MFGLSEVCLSNYKFYILVTLFGVFAGFMLFILFPLLVLFVLLALLVILTGLLIVLLIVLSLGIDLVCFIWDKCAPEGNDFENGDSS